MQHNYTPRQRPIGDKERSLIILASWTALQLESDILAELSLPPSGIQTIENMLPVPDCMLYQEIEKDYNFGPDRNHESYSTISLYYTAMLFIYRKRYGRPTLIYVNISNAWTISVAQDVVSNIRKGIPDITIQPVNECYGSVLGVGATEKVSAGSKFVVVDCGHSTTVGPHL